MNRRLTLAPELTEQGISESALRVTRARARIGEALAERTPAAIAAAGKLFLAPDTYFHARALQAGKLTGLSPAMTHEALRNLFSSLTRAKLETFRHRELNVAPGYAVIPPQLIFHNLAGNLFVSGLESIILGMLTGAANFFRCSSWDRAFPLLWKQALRAVDPAVAATVCVAWWPHAEIERTRRALSYADAVVAYGDDETIQTLRALAPPQTKFVAHGHRISFALIDDQDVSPQTRSQIVRRLAYDFLVYDQRGCMSPLAVVLVSRIYPPVEQFCLELVRAARDLVRRIARPPWPLEDATQLAAAREELKIKIASHGAGGKRGQPRWQIPVIFSDDTDPFLLSLRPIHHFTLGRGYRMIDVWWARTYNQAFSALRPYAGQISSVGVGHFSEQGARVVLGLRAGRICRVGKMQKPSLGWTHDGHLPLLSLMTVMKTEVH